MVWSYSGSFGFNEDGIKQPCSSAWVSDRFFCGGCDNGLSLSPSPDSQDDFFEAASLFARARRLPRLYIACNSGARIGLVESLKPLFKVPD